MWDPSEEISRIKKEMNKMFENFFERSEKRALVSPKKSLKEPLSDIKETNKDVVINLDMPGIDKKDIEVIIKDNTLEVKAEKKQESKIEKKGLYKHERSYTGFYRSLSLPANVKGNKVETDYKNGVLKITIPKAEKKEARKREIKVR